MNKLKLDDLLNLPKPLLARAFGKEITNRLYLEIVTYKVWEERLGVPLEVLAQLIHQNCYYDGKDFQELGLSFINQDGANGTIINLKQWENGDEPIYLKDYKYKYTLGLDDGFVINKINLDDLEER